MIYSIKLKLYCHAIYDLLNCYTFVCFFTFQISFVWFQHVLSLLIAVCLQVYEAARKAAIHDTITSFPEKYSTVVGERGLKVMIPLFILDKGLWSTWRIFLHRVFHTIRCGTLPLLDTQVLINMLVGKERNTNFMMTISQIFTDYAFFNS